MLTQSENQQCLFCWFVCFFWQVGITFSSESSGVTLTNIMKTRSVETGFLVDRGTRELTYRRFTGLPRDVYYWNLPARFLGNKVSLCNV